MTADELYLSLDERKPRTIRPYKIINDRVFLRCSLCEKWKDPVDYSTRHGGDRFFKNRPECMDCQAENVRDYLKRNPEKQREVIERRKKVLQAQSERKESILAG